MMFPCSTSSCCERTLLLRGDDGDDASGELPDWVMGREMPQELREAESK
jgi:hypothetical protein